MSANDARPRRATPPSAADEIAVFARLFEERRAAEMNGGERSVTNAREMDLIAHAIQRHLEHAGRSWLEDPGGDARPESLVTLLAFGTRSDYEPHADRALTQLHEAEALFRTGGVDAEAHRRRRRRHRSRGLLASRNIRIAGLLLFVLAMWGVVLGACGSWGIVEEPFTLTTTERAF